MAKKRSRKIRLWLVRRSTYNGGDYELFRGRPPTLSENGSWEGCYLRAFCPDEFRAATTGVRLRPGGGPVEIGRIPIKEVKSS